MKYILKNWTLLIILLQKKIPMQTILNTVYFQFLDVKHLCKEELKIIIWKQYIFLVNHDKKRKNTNSLV